MELYFPRDPAWLAVLLVLLALSLLLSVSWRPLVWYEWRHVPGDKPYSALFSRRNKWNVASTLLTSGRKHGRHVFKVWVGSTPCAVVNHPELAHHLAMRTTERFGGSAAHEMLMLPQPACSIIDQGVLIANGPAWRQARRAFELTVMQPSRLVGYQLVMQEQANRLCELLAQHCADGTYCDILEELNAVNLSVMGSTAYGGAFEATRDSNTRATEDGKKDRQEPGGQGSKGSKESKQSAGGAVPTQAQQQPRQRLVTAVTQLVQQAPRILSIGSPIMLRALAMPQLQPALQYLLRRFPDAKFKAHSKLCDELLSSSQAFLKSEQDQTLSFRPGSKAGDATCAVSTPKEDSLLGELLNVRSRGQDKSRRLTDEQVLAQPLTFLTAGCAPTATVLALCIYMLCKHPMVEMKVMDEVDTVLKRRAALNSRSAPATPTGSTRGLVLQPEGQATGTQPGRQPRHDQHPRACRLSMEPSSHSRQQEVKAEDGPSSSGSGQQGKQGNGSSGGDGVDPSSGKPLAEGGKRVTIQAERQRSLQVPISTEQGPMFSELLADDLPFTEAVVKEVMRLFPAVPFLRRQAPPDGMDIDGVKVPGNAALLIPVANFHSDAAYFPQPELFRPERFLEVRGPGLHETLLLKNLAPTTPYAYIPFGAGSRMCVGYKYALVHITVMLAAMYSRYAFRLQPGQEPLPIHSSIVTMPDNGVWVKVEERPKVVLEGVLSPR